MAKTNWKKLANKDYLGAWDIEDSDLVLTIKNVKQQAVKTPQGKDEDCIVCEWVESYKPMILNATNCKTISKVYNSDYIEDWVGKKVALFKTMVSAFGDTTEALRVRPYPPRESIKKQLICEECGCVIEGANGLDDTQLAQYTKNKYGKQLCSGCATKLKNNGGNQ